ncbi:MAG: hypothetical protein V1904_00335, partial [Bacteroidota bacterium]
LTECVFSFYKNFMKSSVIFFVSAFSFVITIFLTSGNSDYRIKTVSQYSNELEGTWKVDYAFNRMEWDMDIANGISHQWYEKIIFKKDTFRLENHEWWPPRKSNNGIEYFPYEGKVFIKGTYKIKYDTLILEGYYTDYLYSDNDNNTANYQKTFTFIINSDTLTLIQNAVLKDKLIREKL